MLYATALGTPPHKQMCQELPMKLGLLGHSGSGIN